MKEEDEAANLNLGCFIAFTAGLKVRGVEFNFDCSIDSK
jgi:hypothetical protein